MTTLELILLAAAGVALLAAGAAVGLRRGTRVLTPGAERILFPFSGRRLSREALDAALRLSKAEGATLVPVYLTRISRQLPLDAPVPQACETALPLLDVIEQRASRAGVAVDSRIERGRDPRHALARALEHERYSRVVAVARSQATDGFDPDDIAWLLEHARGEVLILRPERDEPLRWDAPVLGSLG
jgi:nucleotide-binding universal stress UspA family protein